MENRGTAEATTQQEVVTTAEIGHPEPASTDLLLTPIVVLTAEEDDAKQADIGPPPSEEPGLASTSPTTAAGSEPSPMTPLVKPKLAISTRGHTTQPGFGFESGNFSANPDAYTPPFTPLEDLSALTPTMEWIPPSLATYTPEEPLWLADSPEPAYTRTPPEKPPVTSLDEDGTDEVNASSEDGLSPLESPPGLRTSSNDVAKRPVSAILGQPKSSAPRKRPLSAYYVRSFDMEISQLQ
jgi:hypothetical protein